MAFGDLPLGAPLKPNKGHENGACNRQSCQAEPARWRNHGSNSWYCGDCARDIGEDPFNKRHWELEWQPRLGHPMFETREQIDAREAKLPRQEQWATDYADLFPNTAAPRGRSASLDRILRKRRDH